MNPIDLTVRQWQMLVRLCGTPDRATGFIALRPKDVVVTDGHRLFSFPLPEDEKRNHAILAQDLAPWLQSYPRVQDVSVDDRDDDDLPGGQIRLRGSIENERFCLKEGGVRKQGPTLSVLLYAPGHRVADAGINKVMELAALGRVHMLNPGYLRDLHRLWRAFGNPHTGCRLMSSSEDNACAFLFDTPNGEATYIVMRLRDSDPEREAITYPTEPSTRPLAPTGEPPRHPLPFDGEDR